MRNLLRTSMLMAFLAALALATGCEDSPLTVGADFTMTLVPNPSSLTFAPAGPPQDVTLRAAIFSDTGVPQRGLTVLFSTNSGTLRSLGNGVRTDADGIALDVLTVANDAPAQVSVTATSGTLSETKQIPKTTAGVCDANAAPTANFIVSNPTPGPAGAPKPVSPTSTSTDAAPGVITSYSWDCGNATSGGTAAVGACNYVVGSATTIYTITLTVMDDGTGAASPPYPCQKSGTITHTVTIAFAP